ncbi:MAG TPA: D-aminoacylase [Steroidobacteraceae bacterium]|jgi:N-acyl-D-amino-acid deacylase|nr:D-aminoacylase [Steroidobacteraceae bacterium]
MSHSIAAPTLLACLLLPALPTRAADSQPTYDVIIRGGTIYDGSGQAPLVGDVAIRGDRLAYIGPHAPGRGAEEVAARGRAVAPGFVNMLAHPEESLLVDGRALSDLRQGVTLEVIGEDSMGPLTPEMKRLGLKRQGDIHYDIDWTTLGEYLTKLERRGVAPNVASYVGAGTVRTNVLGERDVQPTPAQLAEMQRLVHQAMEEGAMGVTTALIYAPNEYAKTPELIALAKESARCGGIYSVHMRSEGDRLLEGVQETVDIARASGAPAEIYHLKQAGRSNWGKLDALIRAVNAARASGVRITADMYVYTAGATGLDAAMPPWVQDGGLEAWIARLKDPAMRARVLADMRAPKPDWENLLMAAGARGTLLLGFKNPGLKALTGKTLEQVAKARGVSPQDAAIDLVVEDGSRVEVAYFLMSEDNVRREVALPWVSFDSDADAPAPEGVFLKSSRHPRTYGNFARVLAHYVREQKVLTMPQAVHKLAALPAEVLSIKDRGLLKEGYFADVVVFDPAKVQDHSTYQRPQQLATGVEDVWVNGVRALRHEVATGTASGRAVRGRAWTGVAGGGCRASASDWTWSP